MMRQAVMKMTRVSCYRLHIVPPGGAGDPPALGMLNQYLHFPLSDFQQVLFCHELRTPSGEARLVIISFGPNLRAPEKPGMYEAIIIEPAGFRGTPRVSNRVSISSTDELLASVAVPLPGLLASSIAAHGTADFYAGQTDAIDPAGFVLTYDVMGTKRTVRGKLDDSGRRVTLEMAHP